MELKKTIIENTSGVREGLAEHITVSISSKVRQTIEIKDDPMNYEEDTGIPLSSAIRAIRTIIKATRPSERERLASYLHLTNTNALNLRLSEIIPYQPVYDEQYIENLRQKAKKSWEKIDNPDDWLNSIFS